MINILYGLLASLAILINDWTTYGVMANIIEIARSRNGEEDVDLTYDPLKIWRPFCAIFGGIVFGTSGFFQGIIQDFLYVLVAMDIVIMFFLTCADVKSRE